MFDETAQTTEAFNTGLEAGRKEERKKYIEAMRTMSAKIEELEDKHWEECRQIALYEDEIRELKRRVGQLCTEIFKLEDKLLGKGDEEPEEEE